jgi:hypothetical protein
MTHPLAAETTQALQGVTPEAVANLAERLRGEYRIPITDGMGAAGGDEPDNAHEFVRHFPAPPIQMEAAAALTALSAERDALAVKIAEYEAHDGMHGAIVHAIRLLLNEGNVPGAAFIDDHVANAIVQRDALTAQVAELTRDKAFWENRENEAVKRAEAAEAKVADLTRERDALADGKDGWKASSDEYERLFRSAETKLARLEGALSDPVAVHANMLRGTIAKPTVEQIIHIYGADALRAALTEGDTTNG